MGEALTGAFTTAVGTIKTDVTTMISTALPAGLAIMGIGLAVRIPFYREFLSRNCQGCIAVQGHSFAVTPCTPGTIQTTTYFRIKY